MPWNDTAQLDYTKAEVRHAVIETVLHVASMFPIIRFDAAMTLAKRHFSRLWFPLPGSGGAIPSRSDYAMTQDEFDTVFPVEFWREVVDTVKQRAPDTLLLAEAFWMMEGYFVRTLGMHRVYNSAFMNMLKREENEKYRQTIKNVLDFEPEILKRFVNFMNNPDEETAVAQFGNDDKYFGVCTLMCTMPGLPMFGHGQVEGFREKYGMEYRRAKFDEPVNRGLVERHEREIFPLMKKRYLFSGVAEFALFDFMAEGGGVDEDVYAYANGVGAERALVLFNNKFKSTRGRILESIPTRREDGSTSAPTIGQALGISRSQGDWMIFRDASKRLEYLRPMSEIDGGFFWDLGAFKYHVLHEFRGVTATKAMPYDELATQLAGRGVPSIERAMLELRFRPVHEPLRQALGKGHLAFLSAGWDEKKREPTPEALVALEERITHVADGLAYMRGGPTAKADSAVVETVLAALRHRYTNVLTRAHALPSDPKSLHVTSSAKSVATPDAASEPAKEPAKPSDEPQAWPSVGLFIAWAEVEAVIDLLAAAQPELTRAEILLQWELSLPVLGAFTADEDAYVANRNTALVLLAVTLPVAPLREAMKPALDEPRSRNFLGVHEAGGTVWLSKEAFEELAQFIADREGIEGRASVALAEREVEEVSRLAEREGYRANAIAKALVADVKLAPKSPDNERVVPPPAPVVRRPSS
jgi:hypothetical protein